MAMMIGAQEPTSSACGSEVFSMQITHVPKWQPKSMPDASTRCACFIIFCFSSAEDRISAGPVDCRGAECYARCHYVASENVANVYARLSGSGIRSDIKLMPLGM